jgi:hypothetical protein
LRAADADVSRAVEARDHARAHAAQRAIAIHDGDGAAIVERRHGSVGSV